MLEVDPDVIGHWINSFLWPLSRIGAFFFLAPILGVRYVPARIRVLLALTMTAVLMPHLPTMPVLDALSLQSMVIVAQQVAIGIAMALVLQILLQIFVLAGQVIAMQMGLGFASMVDPSNGINIAVVSQFHLMLVTLLFLTMDGHLTMLDVLANSFYALPVDGGFISQANIFSLTALGSWMFLAGLLIALPAVTALLLINMALGIITKAAPQLNIFAIGFPFMLVLGLCILYVTMGHYLPHFESLTSQALNIMNDLLIPQ